ALAEFELAQRLVPQAPVPHRYGALALTALGRYDEAIASYEEYLRIRPDSGDAPAIRARIEALRAEHIEGVVDVLCSPAGALVTVDSASEPLGVTPVRNARLRKGSHV